MSAYLLFPTGTFEGWDVLRGGEQCEDEKVSTARQRWQGENGEVETREQGEAMLNGISILQVGRTIVSIFD